jgi:hypothetical protein
MGVTIEDCSKLMAPAIEANGSKTNSFACSSLTPKFIAQD